MVRKTAYSSMVYHNPKFLVFEKTARKKYLNCQAMITKNN
jgi:hypothetical protein